MKWGDLRRVVSDYAQKHGGWADLSLRGDGGWQVDVRWRGEMETFVVDERPERLLVHPAPHVVLKFVVSKLGGRIARRQREEWLARSGSWA